MNEQETIITYLNQKNIKKIDEIGTNVINSIKPISNDILNIIAKRTYSGERDQLVSVNDQAKEALASLETRPAPVQSKDGLLPRVFKAIFGGQTPAVDQSELKAIDIINGLELSLNKIGENLKIDEKELDKFHATINKAIENLQGINDEVRSVLSSQDSAAIDAPSWGALVEKNTDLTTQIGVFKTITMSIENQLKINKNLQRTTHKSIHQILPIWRSVVANSLSASSLNSVAEMAKQTNDALDMFLAKSVNQQQELTNTVRELEQSKQELPKKIASYLDVLNEIQHEIEDIYVESEKDRLESTKILQEKMDLLEARAKVVSVRNVNTSASGDDQNLLL